MASPFRLFRKHQKIFMAAAVVLCMVIFVFASAFDPSMSGSGRSSTDSETLVTWRGGSLTEGELRNLSRHHRIVNEFLRRLYGEGVRALGSQDFPRVPDFMFNPQIDPFELESRVINTEFTAYVAEAAGMSVSDAVINNYLREWGLRQVGGSGIVALIGSLGRGDKAANEAVVFETLRKLLLVHFYDSSIFDASATVTPLERWHDWRQLNGRVSIQAAILPVADFVEEAPEPTDEQLLELYEQYKDQVPDTYTRVELRNLPQATPGFAEPKRIRLQYLRGSVADWAERLREDVTEEEIVAYYETNKRSQFVERESSLDPIDIDFDALDELGREDGESAPDEDATTQDETVETTDGGDDESETTDDSSSAEAATDEDESPATADDLREVDLGDDAVEQPANDDVAPTEETGEGEGSARSTRPASFQLVNFQADNEAAGDEADNDAEEDASAASDSEDATEADVDASGSSGAAEEDASLDPSADVSSEETGADDGGDAEEDTESDGDASEAETERYTPLDEVRETIRDRIAEDKAIAALPSRMNEALVDLQSAYSDYQNQLITAEEEEQQPPAPPANLTDLQPYADRHELLVENTGLFTYRQLRLETLVGRALNAQTNNEFVADAMIGNSISEWEPYLAHEPLGDWYLVQRIETAPYGVQEFGKVRSQVTQAWKLQEAAKLAEAEAKKLAAELSDGSQDFGAYFADKGYEVVDQTDMFSRKTLGLVGDNQWPMISTVSGLNNVGPDLLDAVFQLQDDEATAALNHDRTEAYVVRIRQREMTEQELRELFLATSHSWLGRQQTTELHRTEFIQTRSRQLQEDSDLNIDAWRDSRQALLQERE